MATIDILRRRIEMAQAKADEYEGVVLGRVSIVGGVATVQEEIIAVSPVIRFPEGCTYIYTGIGAYNAMGMPYVMSRNEEGTDLLAGSIKNARQPAGGIGAYKWMQFCFDIAYIDDVYVLDSTHNVYLWKGKNVT